MLSLESLPQIFDNCRRRNSAAILVDAIIEAFDRDFEGGICLHLVDINPIAEQAGSEETDLCGVDVEIDDDCRR
jgi:hypothetical protein